MEYIVEKIGMSRTIDTSSTPVTLLRLINTKICEVCDELNADEILENFTEKLGEIADDIDDIISRSNSDELEKSEVEFVSDVLKLFNEC